MKITKDNFESTISAYTEDEAFYRALYYAQQDANTDFEQYLASLDRDEIERRRIYVPAFHGSWVDCMEDTHILASSDIAVEKHNRYCPEFEHEHAFYEIFYVYKGQCRNTIEGIRHHCAAGDVCILPPQTKHRIGVFDDSVVINIMIKTSVFHSIFFALFQEENALSRFFSHILLHKTQNNFLLFHAGDDSLIKSLVEDIYLEYSREERYASAILSSYLMLFLGVLLRRHENDMKVVVKSLGSSVKVLQVLNYIQNHYSSVTLQSAAAYFGYSISHFSRLIRESTGLSFTEIVKNIRLDKACHALRDSDLSINSICELSGYASPEHFTRVFKKEFGISPGAYRKKSKE